MDLSVLGLQEAREKLLRNKGFETVEDIQEFFPRTYYDFSTQMPLSPDLNNAFCAVVGTLASVTTKKTNNILMVKAEVYDVMTNRKVNVTWIGSYYIYNIIKNWTDQIVIVCGKLTYSEEYHAYHFNNPIVFDKDIQKNMRIFPVYKKMARISEEWMQNLIKESLSMGISDQIPEDIATSRKLVSREDAVREIHSPSSFESLRQAKTRIIYDKLVNFAVQMETNERKISRGTIYNVKSSACTDAYIKSLPFELTASQLNFYKEFKELAIDGRRMNCLVQGDVGAGKTMVALIAMLLCVESGYQAVMMAPTTILAKQHYEEIKKAADMFGFKVALLAGKQTAKEKKDIISGIRNGEYQFIVGTHAILSDNIQYKALALTVTDEEHKFGVKQRDYLADKAKAGTHTISMSATPIPRTMTQILYGNSIKVYDLELPAERKPIKTCIYNSDQGIFKFIENMINAGEQAYVVNPYIADDEDTDIMSVEESYKKYVEYFGSEKVAIITGKMKPEEAEDIITRFKKNEIKILISTTIIEVGVSVKNANTIVINSAERFGLAQLHQLRGRVGRGNKQGYCILNSKDAENERLLTMCRTTNGFVVAEEDLKQRGGGDLLGTDQSGKTELLDLLAKYPNMYAAAKEDAKKIVDGHLYKVMAG